jgi:anti-anti-sigma regulatory factor
MSKAFSLKAHILDKDLFINLSGVFDGSSAWQLANAILTRFHGSGKLFIDTRDLSKVLPFGADMIVNLVPRSLVRKKNVLVRDCNGTHSGLEHFQTLSDMSERIIPGEAPRSCFSAASIC